ncbi:MAG: DUF1585 domain-containing protein [Sandaracinaceae bacterium]|nr:DUF1585 domain-containing protein [Sandaracinaceae bacterium]
MRRALIPSTVIGALALVTGIVLFIGLSPSEAECLDPELCRPQQTRLDDHGYLRAVSLDVRGHVPSPEEHARVDAEGGLSDAMLDEWLDSPEFAERVVRRHRALIWDNISTATRLYHFRRTLGVTAGLWHQTNRSTETAYRGGTDAADCRDEPLTYAADGSIEVDASGREGYVMVEPFWAPGTSIKVCGFDAQEARFSPSGADCATRAAVGDPGCGCGPNLRWCHTNAVRDAVLRSFSHELEQRIVAHVEADEPYHALLTSRRGFVNGPLDYFWRYHRESSNNVHLVPEAIDVDALPETSIDGGGLAFADEDTWSSTTLPEEHAGLLTHPVYLLRFQTNRARANRFYDAFLCQPFQPPEGGIPLDDEVAAAQPDVQQRPGCNYCHAILEPAAAHWGRWTQQGGGFLEPELFPEFRQECFDCGIGAEPCSDVCRFNYVTRALSPEEEGNLGRLRAFEFLREEHRPNVEEGPAGLVRAGLADGRFTACAVRRTTEWLLGRELREGEEAWTRELTDDFLTSDFRYRDLVRAVVRSETYRRAL